jgi:hypothetical protein
MLASASFTQAQARPAKLTPMTSAILNTADSAAIDGAKHATAPRTALALGMVGALGEELLAALVGSTDYRVVHVAVKQPIATATARFRPWIVGEGVVLADDAFVCLTEEVVAAASPIVRYGPGDVLAAARIARDCGAHRLVLVSPLSALLQLNAAAHTLSSADEVELLEAGFDTVLIVRPTADAERAGGGLRGVARSVSRMVLEIMLPPQVQPLRARTAAAAILEAVRRAKPGISVLGARELLAIVEQTMPQSLPPRTRIR